MCFWLPEPARCCVGSCLQCSHCGALAALHRIRFCSPKITFFPVQVLSEAPTEFTLSGPSCSNKGSDGNKRCIRAAFPLAGCHDSFKVIDMVWRWLRDAIWPFSEFAYEHKGMKYIVLVLHLFLHQDKCNYRDLIYRIEDLPQITILFRIRLAPH
jgi:hypothetical protein